MRITAEMGCSASYWGGTSGFGNGAGPVPQEFLQVPDVGLVAGQEGEALNNQASRFGEVPPQLVVDAPAADLFPGQDQTIDELNLNGQSSAILPLQGMGLIK